MSASMEAAKKPRRTKPKLVVSATTTMAEHGGNLSEAMQAREAAILREQGVTQPWEGDGHMHTGTLADGVGGMQDRELRILMERGAEQLLVSAPLRQLRLVAQHKKLDLSDALEEVAGSSLNAKMGEMSRNRFSSALGDMFGGELTQATLKAICDTYGCGDPDRRSGGYQEVWFKQFAADFDNIRPAAEAAPVVGDELRAALVALRVGAAGQKLDLTDAFESYAGTGREAAIGIMPKGRFRSAMGQARAISAQPAARRNSPRNSRRLRLPALCRCSRGRSPRPSSTRSASRTARGTPTPSSPARSSRCAPSSSPLTLTTFRCPAIRGRW